jgi:hypothetical protein
MASFCVISAAAIALTSRCAAGCGRDFHSSRAIWGNVAAGAAARGDGPMGQGTSASHPGEPRIRLFWVRLVPHSPSCPLGPRAMFAHDHEGFYVR